MTSTTGNPRRAHPTGKISGFSLIELMIVVAVVGILAMITVPAYDRQVLRSNRSAAQQYLMVLASKQEQYMLDARTYTATIATLTASTAATNRYAFAIDIATCAPQPCFTITATPTHPSQVPDGALTLNNLGAKTGNWTSS
jgi:type IV pilus assembly protein PilE